MSVPTGGPAGSIGRRELIVGGSAVAVLGSGIAAVLHHDASAAARHGVRGSSGGTGRLDTATSGALDDAQPGSWSAAGSVDAATARRPLTEAERVQHVVRRL